MDKPFVYCLTATCGRHTCLERVVRFYLDQDYDGRSCLIIYNNSPIQQVLSTIEIPENKYIVVFNISGKNGRPYANLGEIYEDILLATFVESVAFKSVDQDWGNDICTFWDDDDIFLPNHLSEGIRGYLKAKEISSENVAYKPARSFYRHAQGIDLVENTLEPSIFVEMKHVWKHGFHLTTSDQHLKWVEALKDKLYVDKEGKPTLVYNWGDSSIPTFKTSGNPGNPQNFENYRSFSQDHGDGVITPIKKEHAAKYYEQVAYYHGDTNSN